MGRRASRTQVFDGVAFFERCDQELLVGLAPHADRVRVGAGQVLAVAGRHAWQLLVLVEGTARAVGDDGIRTLVAGEAIAPDAAADRATFPETVTALSDVEVLVVNGPAFTGAVAQHPALARPASSATGSAAARNPGHVPRRRRSRRRSRQTALTTRRTIDAAVAALRLAADRPGLGALAPSSPFPIERLRASHGRNSNIVAGIGR